MPPKTILLFREQDIGASNPHNYGVEITVDGQVEYRRAGSTMASLIRQCQVDYSEQAALRFSREDLIKTTGPEMRVGEDHMRVPVDSKDISDFCISFVQPSFAR